MNKPVICVVTLKAEILVEVPHGGLAEEKAREYLKNHPERLVMTTLSAEPTKIKRLKKVQGCIWGGAP